MARLKRRPPRFQSEDVDRFHAAMFSFAQGLLYRSGIIFQWAFDNKNQCGRGPSVFAMEKLHSLNSALSFETDCGGCLFTPLNGCLTAR